MCSTVPFMRRISAILLPPCGFYQQTYLSILHSKSLCILFKCWNDTFYYNYFYYSAFCNICKCKSIILSAQNKTLQTLCRFGGERNNFYSGFFTFCKEALIICIAFAGILSFLIMVDIFSKVISPTIFNIPAFNFMFNALPII